MSYFSIDDTAADSGTFSLVWCGVCKGVNVILLHRIYSDHSSECMCVDIGVITRVVIR